MNQHKQPILDKVREVVALAKQKYQFDIRFQDIDIKFVTKGQAAAQASLNCRTNRYGLKFSLESADIDIREMLEDTVPHEVAHLVNFYDSSTGNNHDYGWQRTCIALGGTGNRTHSQMLSKAKYRKAYLYITNRGNERIVKSAAKHKRIQRGACYTMTRTGESYDKTNFVRIISSDEHRRMHQAEVMQYKNGGNSQSTHQHPTPIPQPTAQLPVESAIPVAPGSTKKQKAQVIYNHMSMQGKTRAQIIDRFMASLSMTKAGANTYYYNCTKN